MAIARKILTTYDSYGRKVTDAVVVEGAAQTLTQYSYDAAGRLQCMAVRMNPATYGSLPASACALGTTGSFGPDRITQNVYDAAGQLLTVLKGVGVMGANNAGIIDRANTYSPNGRVQTTADANGNVTNYSYDDFDRLQTTTYPNPNGGDYEQLGYDANDNITSRRIRNGTTILYSYDALNRLTSETLPAGTGNANPTFTYDLLGHMLQANNGNPSYSTGLSFTWDALGHKLSETATYNNAGSITKSMQYDAAGRRTRLSWGDGFYLTYDYDILGEMTAIHENGGTTLASFAYDDLGRRVSRSLANGTSMSYGYDGVSRLTSLGLNGGTAANNISLGAYDPANEIVSRTNSNDAYAWTGAFNVNRVYTANSLNQYSTIAGQAIGYDPKGNLTSAGGATYTYGAENDLTTGGGGSFWHDAQHRLIYSTSAATRFDYDGTDLVGEYDAAGNILRRYVFGPGTDEPIVWYEGAGTGDKRYMDSDERGSIVRITRGDGSTLAINSYDEYGIPAAANQGRFQYTGQTWLPEIGMYYYKARLYSPTLGRFMQTDPIGYKDGINWYAYAANDPVNGTDPTGEACDGAQTTYCAPTSSGLTSGEATAPGRWATSTGNSGNGCASCHSGPASGAPAPEMGAEIVVTARAVANAIHDGVNRELAVATFPLRMAVTGINWASGISLQTKTPNTGTPGTRHVNPGSGQERWYGPDGKPIKDIDHEAHHGSPNPHVHDWTPDTNGGYPNRGLPRPFDQSTDVWQENP